MTKQVAAGTWGTRTEGLGREHPGVAAEKEQPRDAKAAASTVPVLLLPLGRGLRALGGGVDLSPPGNPYLSRAGAAALTPARVKMNFHSAQFAFRLH